MRVTQLCLILFDPMDYSPPGSSVHMIIEARILDWVFLSFSSFSQLRDRTWVVCNAGRFFTLWATRETLKVRKSNQINWVTKKRKLIEIKVEIIKQKRKINKSRNVFLWEKKKKQTNKAETFASLMKMLLLLLLSHFSRGRLCATP